MSFFILNKIMGQRYVAYNLCQHLNVQQSCDTQNVSLLTPSWDQCFCSPNPLNYFEDALIQKRLLQIIKIRNFRGDVTDVSAIKEPLAGIYMFFLHNYCIHVDIGISKHYLGSYEMLINKKNETVEDHAMLMRPS